LSGTYLAPQLGGTAFSKYVISHETSAQLEQETKVELIFPRTEFDGNGFLQFRLNPCLLDQVRLSPIVQGTLEA
jgi:hypothetical protein